MMVSNPASAFMIKRREGQTYIVLSQEYLELVDSLLVFFDDLNDCQCRHEALLWADSAAVLKLRAMAESLLACCGKTRTEREISL